MQKKNTTRLTKPDPYIWKYWLSGMAINKIEQVYVVYVLELIKIYTTNISDKTVIKEYNIH